MARILKKSLRYFLLLLLGVFIAANLFIILSGRFYLHNGIWNTYLKGESGPSIYDLEVFHNAKLNKSNKPAEYVISPYYNKQDIPQYYQNFLLQWIML